MICLFFSQTLFSFFQINWIRDPIADSTYRDLWLATALVNKHGNIITRGGKMNGLGNGSKCVVFGAGRDGPTYCFVFSFLNFIDN